MKITLSSFISPTSVASRDNRAEVKIFEKTQASRVFRNPEKHNGHQRGGW